MSEGFKSSEINNLGKGEVENILNWSRLARDSRYNRCGQGWKGFGRESCFGYHGYFAFLDATGSV